ncbi:methylated-DNA--[protein]-cysteine S-methyltransferase [Penaeicola halotolerans]|uniref:methylated-DNA--[protein]-cysteine S-methyltransferase n=1 Tax=Penaeicola halotolerans TaxID=2793196 RepID=UPI001CF7F605|nr:methylated-DNA--[protein]-cysteine S-methyltransferase [Penaeicola halotolerans]
MEMIFDSPIGHIRIAREKEGISLLQFTKLDTVSSDDPLLLDCQKQVLAYMRGDLHVFDLPVVLKGTDFQYQVWKEVNKVSYGARQTYQKIANQLGGPKMSRAIGTAVGKNPVLLLIPCHRIVGANGALTGYAGGLDKKKELLRIEALHSGQQFLF